MRKVFGLKVVLLFAGLSLVTSPAFATKKENVLLRQSMAKSAKKKKNKENQKLRVDLSGHLNHMGLAPLQAVPYSQSYLLSSKPEEQALRYQVLQKEAATQAEKIAEEFNAKVEAFSTHEPKVSQVIDMVGGRLILKDVDSRDPILLKRQIMKADPYGDFSLALRTRNWQAAQIAAGPALGPLLKAIGQTRFSYSSKACGLVADALEFGRPGAMRKAASLVVSVFATTAIPLILNYGFPAIGQVVEDKIGSNPLLAHALNFLPILVAATAVFGDKLEFFYRMKEIAILGKDLGYHAARAEIETDSKVRRGLSPEDYLIYLSDPKTPLIKAEVDTSRGPVDPLVFKKLVLRCQNEEEASKLSRIFINNHEQDRRLDVINHELFHESYFGTDFNRSPYRSQPAL